MPERDVIAQVLRNADSVVLVAHANPDADALGSALAMGIALESLGADVQVTFPDEPFNIPSSLSMLPRQDLIVDPDELRPAPVVLALDASSGDRLGRLLALGHAADHFIAIDHHASFDHFADLNLVEPFQPATGMLAREMIGQLGVELTPDIASCLYAAISSDTGSFRYPATTPAALRVAADLMEVGIDFAEVARYLYDSKSLAFLQLQGGVMGALEEQDLDGLRIVVGRVSRADRDAHGLAFIDVEPLIDAVRTVAGIDVAVVLKEDDHGLWRVSARSFGAVDVGRACTTLGGGGHRQAAGFTGSESAESTLDDLLVALASQ